MIASYIGYTILLFAILFGGYFSSELVEWFNKKDYNFLIYDIILLIGLALLIYNWEGF